MLLLIKFSGEKIPYPNLMPHTILLLLLITVLNLYSIKALVKISYTEIIDTDEKHLV